MDIKKRETKEALPTNNLFAIIILLFIITSSFSSYLAYDRAKKITEELSGQAYAEARVCINRQPVLNITCGTIATVGSGYFCNIDATDQDNDTIYFYDNTSLFDIDQNTGEIIFTPTANQTGNYNITITAEDQKNCSNSNVTQTFTFIISLPITTVGGGGGGTSTEKCTPQWECTPWSSCDSEGIRERVCYSLNNCLKDKPAESEDCTYVQPYKPVRRSRNEERYLCNFDMQDECHATFGMLEDWIYTYKNENHTLSILKVDRDRMFASIDDGLFFSANLQRIKGLDVNGDDKFDFEYIVHRIDGIRADTTVRLVKQVEIIIERPVYIQAMPQIIIRIVLFVYDNACMILLIVFIMASMLIYTRILKSVERKKENR